MNENIIEELGRIGCITNGYAVLTMDRDGFHFRDSRNIIGSKFRHDISINSSPDRVESHWNGFVHRMKTG